jgi:hypothetical protein
MKKWKDKLQESSRKIIDTKHSLERYVDRYKSEFSLEDLNQMLNEVMNKILDVHNDKEGTYGWHSKSTGAGGIIEWRLDYKDPNDKNNNAIIVSLLPIKKFHNFKAGDVKIIIEKQVVLWIQEKGVDLKESIKKENFCESYRMGYDTYVSFFEGKLYDFYLDGYIFID